MKPKFPSSQFFIHSLANFKKYTIPLGPLQKGLIESNHPYSGYNEIFSMIIVFIGSCAYVSFDSI